MKKFIIFNLVGIVNTVAGYLIYSFLILIGFNYMLASFFDYLIIGVFLSLFLNKRYTFKVKEKLDHTVVIKATISTIAIFFINIFLLYIAIEKFGLNPYLAQAVVLILIAFFSFTSYKFFIFKGKETV